jgi:hypothetical protein
LLVQRAKEISSQGWGLVSNTFSTCLNTGTSLIQDTIATVRTPRSNSIPPSEDESGEQYKDTSNITNTNTSSPYRWRSVSGGSSGKRQSEDGMPFDPSDLSDLLGRQKLHATATESQSGIAQSEPARPRNPSDLSDLFPQQREAFAPAPVTSSFTSPASSSYGSFSNNRFSNDTTSSSLSPTSSIPAPSSHFDSAPAPEPAVPTPTPAPAAPTKPAVDLSWAEDWDGIGSQSPAAAPIDKNVRLSSGGSSTTAAAPVPVVASDENDWAWTGGKW